jgi:putative Holliday junction resolvase
LKGEVNETTKRVDGFITTLEHKFRLPVERIDERLTSVQARRIMQEMGSSPSKSKAKIDQIAASLILQTYLDRQGIAG